MVGKVQESAFKNRLKADTDSIFSASQRRIANHWVIVLKGIHFNMKKKLALLFSEKDRYSA